MTDYLVAGEPCGEQLGNLISIAAQRCDTFLFVLDDMPLSEKGVQVMARLEPMLLSREETSEYPAGRLAWGSVIAYTYRVTSDAVEVLRSATECLFDWVQPDLPNDLCFLRVGRHWMTTMASDREVVLTLDDGEYQEVQTGLRGLRLNVVH